MTDRTTSDGENFSLEGQVRTMKVTRSTLIQDFHASTSAQMPQRWIFGIILEDDQQISTVSLINGCGNTDKKEIISTNLIFNLMII